MKKSQPTRDPTSSSIDASTKSERSAQVVASFSPSLGRGLAKSHHSDRTRYFKNRPALKRKFDLAWDRVMRSPVKARFRMLSAAMVDLCRDDILVVADDGNTRVIIALDPEENGRYGLDSLTIKRDPAVGVAIKGCLTPVTVTRHAAERFFTRAAREQVPAKSNELPDEIGNVAWLCVADPDIINKHLSTGTQATWRIQTKTGAAVAVLTQGISEIVVTTWMPTTYSGATGAFDIQSLSGFAADPGAFTKALLEHARIEILNSR